MNIHTMAESLAENILLGALSWIAQLSVVFNFVWANDKTIKHNTKVQMGLLMHLTMWLLQTSQKNLTQLWIPFLSHLFILEEVELPYE